jgi:four helix bundle protein
MGVMRIKRVFPLKEVDVTTMEPRTFEFAVAVAELAQDLRATVPETITERLVEIGAEIGADVAEAQGRNGRQTFVLKMNSARLGTRDIVYWLKLGAALEPRCADAAENLLEETEALHDCLTQICARARQGAEMRRGA